MSRKQKFNYWNTHIHDDIDFDPTRKLDAHHLVDEANMADVATSSNRGRKRRLTDSAWKRKKKETNALINKSRIYVGEEYHRWNDLKTVLRLKTHIAVFYSPQLVPIAPV